MATTYCLALIANFLWFLAGFRYFGFRQVSAAKILVPESARESSLFPTITAAIRFLGGMNGAFALASAILLGLFLADSALFNDPSERGILLLIFAAAHFSQFAFNLPVLADGERQGDSYWPILSGPMFFIFVVDGLETVINLGVAFVQISSG
jgi:hypothetical protein